MSQGHLVATIGSGRFGRGAHFPHFQEEYHRAIPARPGFGHTSDPEFGPSGGRGDGGDVFLPSRCEEDEGESSS